jgi:hypothetical protein
LESQIDRLRAAHLKHSGGGLAFLSSIISYGHAMSVLDGPAEIATAEYLLCKQTLVAGAEDYRFAPHFSR